MSHELPTLYIPRHEETTEEDRTGTSFNFLEYPTDIVLRVVLCRLRYKLSLRDLAVMFVERGFVFTHEAARDWEARFAPLLTERLRIKRRGQAGPVLATSFESRPKRMIMHEKCTFILFSAS